MGRKLITTRDRLITRDGPGLGGIGGKVIFGRGRHTVRYIDPYGRPAWRTEFDEVLYQDDNIVTIGGYQFAFDKLFNIGLDRETTLRVGDLNDEAPLMHIGVPGSKYQSPGFTNEASTAGKIHRGVNLPAMNNVFGFMIGDGGAREDNVTAIAPNYKNRTLYHAIPFRMSNDGHALEPNKYFGQSRTAAGATGMESVTSYYVKKFDDPAPHIVHCWVTEKDGELEIVDDTVFASTSSLAIESYVEINLSVSDKDGRGYSTMVNATPRINEFALVTGWYNADENDYEALRMITHFTRPSITLTEGDGIEALYRLYAR